MPAPTRGRFERFIGEIQAFETNCVDATAELLLAFKALKARHPRQNILDHCSAGTRKLVAIAKGTWGPASAAASALQASRWNLTVEQVRITFSDNALLSDAFLRNLSHFAATSDSPWEQARNAIVAAADARRSNTSKRQRVSLTRDWVPADVTDAMIALEVPLPRKTRRKQKRAAEPEHEPEPEPEPPSKRRKLASTDDHASKPSILSDNATNTEGANVAAQSMLSPMLSPENAGSPAETAESVGKPAFPAENGPACPRQRAAYTPALSPVREEFDESEEPGAAQSPRSLATPDWSDGFESRASSPGVEQARLWVEPLDDFDESHFENSEAEDYTFAAATAMADADTCSQPEDGPGTVSRTTTPAATDRLEHPTRHDVVAVAPSTGYSHPSHGSGNHRPALPAPTTSTGDVMALKTFLGQLVEPQKKTPEWQDEMLPQLPNLKLLPLASASQNVTVRRKRAMSEALHSAKATHQAEDPQENSTVQKALRQLHDNSWLDHGTIHEILGRLVSSKVKVLEINSPEAQQSGWDAWAKAAPYRLGSDVRFVLAPLHRARRQHWVLIRLDVVRRRATVHDSMRLDAAHYGFELDAAKAITARLGLDWDIDGWEFEVECKAAQQAGVDDCGIFVVTNCLYCIAGLDLPCNVAHPRMWRWIFTCLLDDTAHDAQQAISAITTNEAIEPPSESMSKYADAKKRHDTIKNHATYAKECIRVLQTVSTILQEDARLLQLERTVLQTELLSRALVLDMHRQLSGVTTRAGDATAEQSLQEGVTDLRGELARTFEQHQLVMECRESVDAAVAATDKLRAEMLLVAQGAKDAMDGVMNEIIQEHARLGNFIAGLRKRGDANE